MLGRSFQLCARVAERDGALWTCFVWIWLWKTIHKGIHKGNVDPRVTLVHLLCAQVLFMYAPEKDGFICQSRRRCVDNFGVRLIVEHLLFDYRVESPDMVESFANFSNTL